MGIFFFFSPPAQNRVFYFAQARSLGWHTLKHTLKPTYACILIRIAAAFYHWPKVSYLCAYGTVTTTPVLPNARIPSSDAGIPCKHWGFYRRNLCCECATVVSDCPFTLDDTHTSNTQMRPPRVHSCQPSTANVWFCFHYQHLLGFRVRTIGFRSHGASSFL